MTVQNLIERSLRKIQVLDEGESASAAQITDGIEVLNDLLYDLSVQRWGIHKTTVVSHTLTLGTSTYTIGSAGDIATARPIRILKAYLRRGNVDYNVEIRASDYMDSIHNKTTKSQPWNLQYEPTYPNGTITLDPVPPNSTDTLYMRLWQPIAVYTSGSETIDLPPEYQTYLMWALGRDYASEFKLPVPDNVNFRAMESMKTLKGLHAQPVPQQRTNIIGTGYSRYDITSDRYFYDRY